ncbi:hypothetical protein HDU82_001817 [Entophlyctis luteolus]|nr:hypothetical protein HDU82_001817 [Entophlyctis luteolus]
MGHRGTTRVFATIEQIQLRSTFCYPSCDRCARKLVAIPSASGSSSSSSSSSMSRSTVAAVDSAEHMDPRRRPTRAVFADASSSSNMHVSGPAAAGTAVSGTAAHAPAVSRADSTSRRAFLCRSCHAQFNGDCVKYRYAVSMTVSFSGRLKTGDFAKANLLRTILNIFNEVTAFGNSLDPLFGLSCTSLHRALQSASLQALGTQTPSIDSRRVLNALNQVAAGLSVVLHVRGGMWREMNELSDLLERGLQIRQTSRKPPATLKTATSNVSKGRFASDIVVSSIELPIAPSVTVAHMLGLVEMPKLKPFKHSTLPAVAADAAAAENVFDTFSRDLYMGLLSETTTATTTTTTTTTTTRADNRDELSPPSTPRRAQAASAAEISSVLVDGAGADELEDLSVPAFFGLPSPPKTQARGDRLRASSPAVVTLVPASPMPTVACPNDASTPPIRGARMRPKVDDDSPFFVAETPTNVAAVQLSRLSQLSLTGESPEILPNRVHLSQARSPVRKRNVEIRRDGTESDADLFECDPRKSLAAAFSGLSVGPAGEKSTTSPKKKARFFVEMMRKCGERASCIDTDCDQTQTQILHNRDIDKLLSGVSEVGACFAEFSFGGSGEERRRGDEEMFGTQFFRNVARKAAAIANASSVREMGVDSDSDC